MAKNRNAKSVTPFGVNLVFNMGAGSSKFASVSWTRGIHVVYFTSATHCWKMVCTPKPARKAKKRP